MKKNQFIQLAKIGIINIVDETDGNHQNICVVCGKKYDANGTVEFTCSDECATKSNRVNYTDSKSCIICKREFKGNTEICLDCHYMVDGISRRKETDTVYIRNCDGCGRTFTTMIKRRNHCCNTCKDASYNQVLTKACQQCGKLFKTRHVNKICCSDECHTLYVKNEGIIDKYSDIMK